MAGVTCFPRRGVKMIKDPGFSAAGIACCAEQDNVE